MEATGMTQDESPGRVRGAGFGGTRTVATLTVLAALLVVAFVAAPGYLAGGVLTEPDIRDRFRLRFETYWQSGQLGPAPQSAGIVDYWCRYHLAKAGIAAILLVALVALGLVVLRGPARSWVRIGSAAMVSAAAVGAGAVLLANVQGTVAPFASLLPMLTEHPADPQLARTLAEAARQVTTGPRSPAATGLIAEFARYHLVLGVAAAILAVALAGTSAAGWRRVAAGPAGGRAVTGIYTATATLTAVALAVLTAANLGTAADPAPALADFLAGGW
jgi:hypothetical protein